MYIYVYIYIYTYMCVYYIHDHMYMYICTTWLGIFTCMYRHIDVCVYMYVAPEMHAGVEQKNTADPPAS